MVLKRYYDRVDRTNDKRVKTVVFIVTRYEWSYSSDKICVGVGVNTQHTCGVAVCGPGYGVRPAFAPGLLLLFPSLNFYSPKQFNEFHFLDVLYKHCFSVVSATMKCHFSAYFIYILRAGPQK